MSGWEKIIGDAILGNTSQDVGIARVVVKTATCHHMFCPRCGSVMDQNRTIVVETVAGDRETPINQVSCGMTRDDGSTCEPSRAFLLKISEGMAERWPDKPRVHFNVNTWEGIERIPALPPWETMTATALGALFLDARQRHYDSKIAEGVWGFCDGSVPTINEVAFWCVRPGDYGWSAGTDIVDGWRVYAEC